MLILLFLISFLGANPVTIPFRQFSTAPTLGGTGNTDPEAANYGALQFFLDQVLTQTVALSDGTGTETVQFQVNQWNPSPGCTVLDHVGGQNSACPPQIAALDAGSALSPVWGFLANSGQPFGMPLGSFLYFLNSATGAGTQSGLSLVQALLDARSKNVIAIPVLASPPASSGLLQMDLAKVDLASVCRANWTWRYLSPGADVLNFACTSLVGTAKQLNFINAVAGQPFLSAVQSGTVQAFDYSSARDTLAAFFPPLKGPSPTCSALNPVPQCYQNPGQKGLIYLHYPSWYQPFFLGWMYINAGVWQSLTQAQRDVIRSAATEATRQSFRASYSVECQSMSAILAFNDQQVQVKPDGSVKDCDPLTSGTTSCSADITLTGLSPATLETLQQATTQYLFSLQGTSPDQEDYDLLLSAILDYQRASNFRWHPEQATPQCDDETGGK